MFTFFIAVHVIICIVLIAIVLLQPGQGQGLSETLGGGMAESILGSKASSFLTKTTTILAILFFIICLSVTVLSVKRSKSLIKEKPVTKEESKTTQKTHESPKSQPTNK